MTTKKPINIYNSNNEPNSLQASVEFSITPNDDNDIATPGATLFISSSTDDKVPVKLSLVGSPTVAITRYLSPGYHPLNVKRVYATGTTLGSATLIGQA